MQGIVPESKWRVLNNGINLRHYTPDDTLRSQFRNAYGLGEQILIGTACALRERKQVEHLIQVGKSLPKHVTVCLAGGPIAEEHDYAVELLRWAKAELGDRFITTGHIKDLRPFFNALDLFVNTSREEACSISVLESMACGCPVVGYASRSVHTQILPGGGEITPQDDIQALAHAVERWIKDPADLRQARQSAREHVAAEFDIQVLSQRLLGEYESVCKEHAGK